ncbi:uncharacterized protein K02A2.6-like [Paramuricea clavata]|uniref:Uncharacterized protein K02A2.6-like n=1 Tax=Paramuricea clavata TaxID=317549 RepID=A0A6S7H8M7_PARCT|nr:uncharacterized protein K02A2.6-like [Paramuricea clavata]
MLIDWLVCGVNEDHIQRRLLAESTLDLKRALDIAIGMETAAKDMRDLKRDAIDSQNRMHKLQGRMNKDNNVNDEYSCFRCGGERVSPLGILEVTVKYGNQTRPLPLLVLAGTGPYLCGRNWLESIHLDWSSIRRLGNVNLEDVLKRYDHLFNEELGMLHGIKAKIHLKPMTEPTFYQARSVPYSMRSKIEKELERLEREGTIEAVQYSEWANPGSTRYQARWECEVMRGLQTDCKSSFSPRCISDTQDRGTT